MIDRLFIPLGIVALILVVAVVSWLVHRWYVSWLDTNGNGVIDKEEKPKGPLH